MIWGSLWCPRKNTAKHVMIMLTNLNMEWESHVAYFLLLTTLSVKTNHIWSDIYFTLLEIVFEILVIYKHLLSDIELHTLMHKLKLIKGFVVHSLKTKHFCRSFIQESTNISRNNGKKLNFFKHKWYRVCLEPKVVIQW